MATLFPKGKIGGLKTIIIILCIILGIALLSVAYLAFKKYSCPDCKCPESPPCNCPVPKECPACVCNPNVTTTCPSPSCPQPICPGYCNISDDQMKTITANISSANGSPNKWVEVGLFGFITTLFSLLIALVDTKNRIAAVIASIAYLSVLVYMFIFGYAEYAVYGFLVFIAVGMTRLFIKKDEDTVR